MLDSILNALFGCSHNRMTFPLTQGRNFKAPAGTHRRGTYVACLDCGQEFRYDWAEMRIGEPVASRVRASGAESFSTANQ